jgi:NhaP-type Na+/H+ or K+/H+ antiporter
MTEIALIIVLGIFAQWIAWKSRVPAILPLILIGLIVGPMSQLWLGGEKWIDPMYEGEGDSQGLFLRNSMFSFVSLAIGIILFEGGLTLKIKEIKDVGRVIGRLITLGSLVTFIGGAITAHYLCMLSWDFSFLFAALIIVTGPTVIAPILRNVPLNRNVAAVLKWEGILIDPIGALAAVLVYEFIIASLGGEGIGHFSQEAFITFVNVLAVGVFVGVSAALLLKLMIMRDWIPHYLLNVFTLALVLLVFVLSDAVAHESGLLTVVVMGMTLANLKVPKIKEILDFKESLTILLISILFIILSANIDITELQALNWSTLALFGIVVLVLRPIGVFLSTYKSELAFNEKLFISWVGPRGIVAAGIASLFGLKLVDAGFEEAAILTPLVFSIVLGTVLLNATTARLMARVLKVKMPKSDGILIVGANRGARLVAQYLHGLDKHVVLIDSSEEMIEKADKMGLESIQENIYNLELEERFELLDMGYLMAMTASDAVNEYACKHYKDNFGENGTFRLISKDEMEHQTTKEGVNTLFCETADYLNLNEMARDYPMMHEVELTSDEDLVNYVKQLRPQKSIPLFIRSASDEIRIVAANCGQIDIFEGDKLVFLGEPLKILPKEDIKLLEQPLADNK